MPPTLALALTLLGVLFFFRWDAREPYRPSFALWIPSIWMLILGSRAVSLWFNPALLEETFGGNADALIEGSPLDRMIYAGLIIAGILVLLKRRISWRKVFRENPWLVVYFIYCGLSTLWSDYPLVSSKRWVKALGDPIMGLVVATESEPMKAVETLLKRCGFVLLPFSILLIKYYPHLGRHFEYYSGYMSYTGVTTDKNMLGFQCMVVGLFAVYKLFVIYDKESSSRKKPDFVLPVALLAMSLWLLWMANSKTPTLSLILGTCVIGLLGKSSVRRNLNPVLICIILVYGILELTIGLTTLIITLAGRDPTLTGRTELWEIFLSMKFNYWIGHGFESFWLGDRLEYFWSLYFFKPNEAHNGYIEVYLNLGYIGLFILGGVLLSTYSSIRKMLNVTLSPLTAQRLLFDRFRLAYLLSYLIYNVSEAGFRSLNFVFVTFVVLTIQYHQSRTRADSVVRDVAPQREVQLPRISGVR